MLGAEAGRDFHRDFLLREIVLARFEKFAQRLIRHARRPSDIAGQSGTRTGSQELAAIQIYRISHSFSVPKIPASFSRPRPSDVHAIRARPRLCQLHPADRTRAK